MSEKKYFKSGLLLTTENILLGVIKFLLSIVIVKKFGSSVQGEFSYINTIAAYFTIFSIAVIDQSNIVSVPKIKSQVSMLANYFGSVIITALLFIAISLIIFWELVNFNLLQKLPLPFYIIAFYISLFAFRQVLRTVLLGTEKYIFHSVVNILVEITLITLMYFTDSLLHYILSACFVISAPVILFSINILKGTNWKISYSISEVKTIFKYGSKMFFFVVFQTVLLRIDVFFIMYMYDAKTLSYYMICTVFAELIVLPSKSITVIIINKAITQESGFSLNNFRVITTLILCIGLGMLIVGTFLIPFLYGNEYGKQINVFWVQCIGSIIVANIYIYTYFLLGKGYNKIILLANSVSLIPALVLYYFLSKQFNIIGTSIASTLSYSIIFFTLIFWMRKNLTLFNTFEFLLPTIGAYHFFKNKINFKFR